MHEHKLLCDKINCNIYNHNTKISIQLLKQIICYQFRILSMILIIKNKKNQGKFISIHTPAVLDLLRAQSPSLSPEPSPTSNFLASFGTTSCMLRRSTFFFSLLLPDSIITGRSKRPAVCQKYLKLKTSSKQSVHVIKFIMIIEKWSLIVFRKRTSRFS